MSIFLSIYILLLFLNGAVCILAWAMEHQNKKLVKDGNIDSTTSWKLLKSNKNLLQMALVDRVRHNAITHIYIYIYIYIHDYGYRAMTWVLVPMCLRFYGNVIGASIEKNSSNWVSWLIQVRQKWARSLPQRIMLLWTIIQRKCTTNVQSIYLYIYIYMRREDISMIHTPYVINNDKSIMAYICHDSRIARERES